MVSSLAYIKGIRIAYEDLKDYLEVLLIASTMVFTLMGLWVAFIYPNALMKVTDPTKIAVGDFSEAKRDTKRLELLVLSILRSALVVSAILGFYLAKLLISHLDIYIALLDFFKSVSIGMAVTLSVIQLESIFAVVVSNITFLNDLHDTRERKELDLDV